MKYKVIKEYAGIEVGSEIKIAEGAVKYMVESGYVEPIQVEDEKKVTFEISGEKLRGVLNKAQIPDIDVTTYGMKPQNKAIEPKYKRNRNAN